MSDNSPSDNHISQTTVATDTPVTVRQQSHETHQTVSLMSDNSPTRCIRHSDWCQTIVPTDTQSSQTTVPTDNPTTVRQQSHKTHQSNWCQTTVPTDTQISQTIVPKDTCVTVRQQSQYTLPSQLENSPNRHLRTSQLDTMPRDPPDSPTVPQDTPDSLTVVWQQFQQTLQSQLDNIPKRHTGQSDWYQTTVLTVTHICETTVPMVTTVTVGQQFQQTLTAQSNNSPTGHTRQSHLSNSRKVLP